MSERVEVGYFYGKKHPRPMGEPENSELGREDMDTRVPEYGHALAILT